MFTDEPTFQPAASIQSPSQDMDVDNEDDHDLSLILTKSRQKNIELLRRHFQAEQEQPDSEENDNLQRTNANGLVISDVSDFLASVKRPERLKRAKVEVKDEAEATAINGNGLKGRDTVDTEEIPQPSPDENGNRQEAQEEKWDDEDVGFIDEPLVSKGVASTLAFLSSRGMGLKINTTNEPFDFSDIAIQYHDEFGNVISAKEAYKQLSHRFHGKGPGKNKEEKRLKKIAESAKMKKASMSGDGSASLQRSKQKETGETHITLAKGNKGVQPGETTTLAPVKAEAEKRPSKPVPAKKPKIFGML
jgi:U4/U6.U5 tri-snRNP-associated protein 1